MFTFSNTRDSYKYDSSMEEKANPNNNMQDQEYEEADDEKTLSFCDLPIYNDAAAEWETEDQISLASSSSSSDQGFFEFFSEDLSTSSAYPVDNNIVFCGKLIASKEPNSDTELKHKLESCKQEKPIKRGLFRWISKLFGTSKSTQPKRRRCVWRPKSIMSLPVSENKYGYNNKVAQKGGEKYGYSVRRVSILAVPAKPRWNFLMFGLASIPLAEMELSDIRSRQGRRSGSSPSGGAEKLSGGKGLWGAWWLIRALGCGGQLHSGTTMQTPP